MAAPVARVMTMKVNGVERAVLRARSGISDHAWAQTSMRAAPVRLRARMDVGMVGRLVRGDWGSHRSAGGGLPDCGFTQLPRRKWSRVLAAATMAVPVISRVGLSTWVLPVRRMETDMTGVA